MVIYSMYSYSKRLRGFTCYPDGSRGGQPLTRVRLEDALKKEGVAYKESEHECVEFADYKEKNVV